jgi:hypothetical protein
MKNDDIKKYLIQLRDILNHLINQPKNVNLKKMTKPVVEGKSEIHLYLIPLMVDEDFEDGLIGPDDLSGEAEFAKEETWTEEKELTGEINAFDKAFLRKYGIRY